MKRTRCKGKNGKKGKGEVLDLIVTIDLVSNRNSNMVHRGRFALNSFAGSFYKSVIMLDDKRGKIL